MTFGTGGNLAPTAHPSPADAPQPEGFRLPDDPKPTRCEDHEDGYHLTHEAAEECSAETYGEQGFDDYRKASPADAPTNDSPGEDGPAQPGAAATPGIHAVLAPFLVSPDHILDGLTCWCRPYRDAEDPEVIIHQQEARA